MFLSSDNPKYSMHIVGLGNSNNLTWMTLHSAACNVDASSTLYVIDKGKLRDTPPVDHPNIDVNWISRFSFESLSKIHCKAPILNCLRSADLVLVSGEFIGHAEEIRYFIPEKSKIIAIPIGFDLEVLTFSYHNSSDPIKRAISEKMFKGLTSCDYTHSLDNSTTLTLDIIRQAGLSGKTPTVWKHIHVLRLFLAKTLLENNKDRIPAQCDVDLYQKSIFVASRLCKSEENSVANKGTEALYDWILENYGNLKQLAIPIILIQRDEYSKNFIDRIKFQCKDTHLIHSVSELSYAQFLYLLRNCRLAVDSFSLTDSLRPHMTTSDAIAVGTPLVTSFGKTCVADIFKQDSRIRLFRSPGDYLFSRSVNERFVEFGEEYLADYQNHLYSYFWSYTDKAESNFLDDLASGRDISSHFS